MPPHRWKGLGVLGAAGPGEEHGLFGPWPDPAETGEETTYPGQVEPLCGVGERQRDQSQRDFPVPQLLTHGRRVDDALHHFEPADRPEGRGHGRGDRAPLDVTTSATDAHATGVCCPSRGRGAVTTTAVPGSTPSADSGVAFGDVPGDRVDAGAGVALQGVDPRGGLRDARAGEVPLDRRGVRRRRSGQRYDPSARQPKCAPAPEFGHRFDRHAVPPFRHRRSKCVHLAPAAGLVRRRSR